MEEEKQICYPYAWGRLDAALYNVALNLEMECIKEDIEVDDRVFIMLNKRLKALQKVAVEESFDKH